MKFQRQSRESQEKLIDYEIKGELSEGQMNARYCGIHVVPSIVSHFLSL